MGKHARIGKVETEIERLGKEHDMPFGAVDINPEDNKKWVQVIFQYAGYPSTRDDPGEPSGGEAWIFRQVFTKGDEFAPEGNIKHEVYAVQWNGETVAKEDVDPDFKEFVLKEVIPLLDAHFTRELY